MVLNALSSMGLRMFMFVLLGRRWGFGSAVSRVSLNVVGVTEQSFVRVALLEVGVLGIGGAGLW